MRMITVRFVAIYQLVSAIAFASSAVAAWTAAEIGPFSMSMVLCMLNLAIGVALLWQVGWAYVLGTVNMALQVPAVNSQVLSYWYIGIGDLFVSALLDPSSSTYLFGPLATFSPGTFSLSLGDDFQGVELYFGVFAAFMTAILAMNCRRRRL